MAWEKEKAKENSARAHTKQRRKVTTHHELVPLLLQLNLLSSRGNTGRDHLGLSSHPFEITLGSVELLLKAELSRSFLLGDGSSGGEEFAHLREEDEKTSKGVSIRP